MTAYKKLSFIALEILYTVPRNVSEMDTLPHPLPRHSRYPEFITGVPPEAESGCGHFTCGGTNGPYKDSWNSHENASERGKE